MDHILRYQANPDVKLIVLLGEVNSHWFVVSLLFYFSFPFAQLYLERKLINGLYLNYLFTF